MPQLLTNNLKRLTRAAADQLPTGVRRQAARLVQRPERVEERPILGQPLQIQGGNHGDADYDDAWLVGLLSESDGFVDVGCNVGFFSLASCILRPTSNVLAIDGNPECAAVTAANLVRNGFGERARAISAFVSDSQGDVEFQAVGTGAAGSAVAGLSPTAEWLGETITVRTQTLDTIIERTGISPDLIKVDVEGAEREVLSGATRTVEEHHPRFMVEMHSGGALTMEKNVADVLAWCENHGYDAWYLKDAERLTSPAPVAQRGRCHLLLQQCGEPYPSVLEGIEQGAPIDSALKRL